MISGAGSSGPGLSTGRAAALLFAQEGARVFALDVNEASLRETCDAIAAKGGVVDSAVVDIRNLVKQYGRITALKGVTLTGNVNSDMEKQIAGMRASGAGLGFGPVVNNITVENPRKKS